MRVAVIINPIAGSRRQIGARDRRDEARAWFDARSMAAEIALTASRGHATELARAFVRAGMDRVIAWGGDGTVNEVAGPLIGTDVVLGLVPAGSGDGLAGGLGLPSDPSAALAVAMGDAIVALDVGWLGTRHFLNVGGFGFDAVVADAFQHDSRRGLSGYLRAGLTCLWSYRPVPCDLDLDGVVSHSDWFLVAFANGREYGNGFLVAPDGDPSDGLLDVVVVENGPRLTQLWRGRSLFLRKVMPVEGVRRYQVRRATIAGTGLSAHVDGEPFVPVSPVSIRVDRGAIRLAATTTRAAAG